MLATTMDAIKAMLKADPSLTADDRATILASLRNHGKASRPEPVAAARILKRREVAARLGCCPRTVDGLARNGSLRRILFPGRKRGAGFVEADVVRLMECVEPQNVC